MKCNIITRRLINLISGCSRTNRTLEYCTKVTNNLEANLRTGSWPNYSSEQQTKILRILNESSTQELARFDVSKHRAELLNAHRSTCGHFDRLERVLEVRGIGERGMERLCDSILVTMDDLSAGSGILERAAATVEKQIARKPTARSTLVVPSLDEERRKNLHVAVGIHLGINTVSWASINSDKRLLEWDLHSMDFEPKKIHITTLLDTVLEVRNSLPEADAYIFEDASSSNQPAQQQITSLSVQLQKSQLSAMLLTLLNASGTPSDPENRRRVYYLRSRTPARLFRTLVGSERVSAQATVRDILSSDSQPVHYSPIVVDESHRSLFESKASVEREKLCHALLLTMAFMDLAVFQTPQSLKVVQGR